MSKHAPPNVVFSDPEDVHLVHRRILPRANALLDRDLDLVIVDVRRVVASAVTGESESTRRLVVSHEGLSGDMWTDRNARLMTDIFAEVFDPAQVMVVVRRQHDLIRSIWGLYMLRHGTLDFASSPPHPRWGKPGKNEHARSKLHAKNPSRIQLRDRMTSSLYRYIVFDDKPCHVI